WDTYGMNATVFSSDQSYWGFGDVPQNNSVYSRIRALLAADSKCLVTLWTTTGINQFHQAGSGETVGQSFRYIMNHNQLNNYLEKPPQYYDTPDWWNRTHFAYYGDPALRLYQVYPASNLLISDGGNGALLNWNASPDSRIAGYHVYKSNTEFGIYQRISGNVPLTATNFTDVNYQTGQWYMVRAVIHQTTGSGIFVNPSLGTFAQGNVVLNAAEINRPGCKLYPNPSNNSVTLELIPHSDIQQLRIVDVSGRCIYSRQIQENENRLLLDEVFSENGVYLIEVIDSAAERYFVQRFVKL
ncbi:MAG: T9SS type A sorting domain-containing protein, partial [Bacteroidia bacterium]